MESQPLLLLAQSYIQECCPSAPINQAEKAVSIIEKFVDNTISLEDARTGILSALGTAVPLEKINDIITIDDAPLPPLQEAEEVVDSSPFSKKRKLNPWSQTEDLRLLAGITKFGLENWIAVAKFVGNSRTRAQCSQRWNRGLDPHLKKCRWTKEEEAKLTELIQKYGLKAWTQISQKLGNRSDVQCRYHYNQMKKNRTAGGLFQCYQPSPSNLQQVPQYTTICVDREPSPVGQISPVSTPSSLEVAAIVGTQKKRSEIGVLDSKEMNDDSKTKTKSATSTQQDLWDIAFSFQDVGDDWTYSFSYKSPYFADWFGGIKDSMF